MALTPDFANKLILSDASITDIVAFHEALRDIEQSDTGMLYPTVHGYKKVDLGGGAYFHDLPFLNGWQLKFPTPGNYTVIGNVGATIVPVAGVFVDRTKSAAFATVAGSGGSPGPTAADIWAHAIDGIPAEQLQKLFAAALLGKVSGAGTGTEVFRSIGDTKNRITATVDANGNRTSVTLDGA
jgi:hypothetical protein